MTDATTPARPPFKLVGPAAIKHLNVRKECPEDDKILAVDVKLTFKQVDRRLCAFFDDALEDFLWRGETDALIVRNDFLNPVAYFNEVSGATVKIGMRDFFGCDVKKFSIQPADGGVITLTCSVSLYPSSGEVADLARLVQDEERVEIEGPPDLFAAPADEAPASEAAARLDALAREDGCSATLVSSDGETLLTFGDGPDPMYEQATELVRGESGKASISYVQRKLRIGYNRAARLLEAMEQQGLVSEMNAAGAREVLA